MLNRIKKSVLVSLVILIFSGLSLTNAEEYAKIRVNSDTDVTYLLDNGYELLDVNYINTSEGSRYLEWNRENGFVTLKTGNLSADRLVVLPENTEFFEAENINFVEELDEIHFNMKWGWPRLMNGGGVSHQTVAVANIDGYGGPDVITHAMNGWQYAWQNNGAWIVGFPFEFEATYNNYSAELSWESSAISDIDGDGYPDVVFGGASGSINWISVPRIQNEEFEWLNIGENLLTGTPVIVDVNNDGNKEVIVNSYEFWGDFPHNGLIHVLDISGNELEGFPVSYPNPSSSTASVADIDGDNEIEIIIGTAQNLETTGAVYAWNLDGTVVNGWPIEGFYTIGGSPALADLDGDNSFEVIIRCKEIGGINGIYAWHGDGSLVENFPIQVEGGHPNGSIAIADMDGDGVLEFAYGTVQAPDRCSIYVYQENGDIKPGFPHSPGSTWVGGSPIFADVTGDGNPEVIVCLRNPASYSPTIMCYDANGDLAGYCSTGLENGDNLPSTPTAWDIDQDGFIEIAAVTSGGEVFIWDTEGIQGSSYPCEKGDFSRTGRYTYDVPGISSVSDNHSENIPMEFKVENIYPSPFNSSVRINYVLPASGNVSITVHDILGRQIQQLVSGYKEVGRNEINWHPVSSVSSGLYFVKVIYDNQVAVKKLVYAK